MSVMKQLMIVLLFLKGVAPQVQYKYYLIQQNKRWSDARTYCRTNHVDLATIQNDADMVKLQAEAQTQQFTSDAWFGVYREFNEWRWSYGDETLETEMYWLFNTNQEECVSMHYFWYLAPCAQNKSFVCYDERNTGASRYIHITNNVSWYEAQSYCRLHHTDLASTRDFMEHLNIAVMLAGKTWIGLYRTSTWKWLDQTNLANITWTPGQPDNQVGFENCGYLSSFQAADSHCSFLKPFFCHGVITGQKQIVKFEVQSDQNMNDPAVKAALLEKILQKLIELGVEQNITLKWREQPDGEVFHKIKADGSD